MSFSRIFFISLVLFGVVLAAGFYFYTSVLSPTSAAIASPVCYAYLWNHVYNPGRLEVMKECTEVTGVIEHVKSEADGDLHIRLRLDTEFSSLLNDENMNQQEGDLVLEPVCQREVAQLDAIDSCRGFSNILEIPPVGTHVRVDGSYVLDKPHGWMEIHPVSRIAVMG